MNNTLTKTLRVSIWVNQEDTEKIELAAAILGKTFTQFIVECVLESANHVIETNNDDF